MNLYILIAFSVFQDPRNACKSSRNELTIYLFANSTPTVGRLFGSKVSFLNRLMSAVLPTSESPVKMTLKEV